MSKKIMAAFESMGLTLIDKDKAYGKIRAYEVSAADDRASDVFKTAMMGALNRETNYNINISFYATSEQKEQINVAIKDAKLSMFMYKITEFGIMFTCGGMTYGSVAKRLPELTNKVLDIIEGAGGKTSEFCPYCGEQLTEENATKIKIDNKFTITLHSDCRDKINSAITDENTEFEKRPGNYLRGALGACLGGIIGGVATLILLFFGFVASLPAALAAILGGYFYEKFGGKPNKIMIVIVSVAALAFTVLSVLLGYMFAANGLCLELGVQLNWIEAFSICMEDPEFSKEFWLAIGMTMMFAAIGIVFEIFYFVRKIKRKQNL